MMLTYIMDLPLSVSHGGFLSILGLESKKVVIPNYDSRGKSDLLSIDRNLGRGELRNQRF